jgi:hypothetical protein
MFDAIGQVVDVSYASGTAGTPKLAANLDANNNKITNLTTPTAAADAANKSYVDASGVTLLDEDNMASNSATAAASQQSVKAYVDGQVATKASLGLVIALG